MVAITEQPPANAVELATNKSLAQDADALVKKIAADIAKEVAHHIATMYPKAVEATTPNMLRSVRGCVYNEIIAAIGVTDEAKIIERLSERGRLRRWISRMSRANRSAGG